MSTFAVLAQKKWCRAAVRHRAYADSRGQRCTLEYTHLTHWGVALEWKLADCWIGAFVRRDHHGVNAWVCLLPCLPIHVWWYR